MQVRKYEDKDIVEMVSIWNEVVEKGDAFPQEELLDEQTGADFFIHKAIAELHKVRMERLSGFTFCIRIILGGVGISVMRALQ